MAKAKRKTTADAVEILHRRYYAGKPQRLAALEQARANDQVARKLTALRIAHGLSQRQLAKLIGTTASVICRLEDANYEGHSLAMLNRLAGNRRKRIDGNPTSREIGKILDGVSRCCMAGSVGGDGRASPEQEFRRQDQARHAIGIAELFTHLCGAAEGFLRQTGFRYRSHSDGRGFGSAGAAQPGD